MVYIEIGVYIITWEMCVVWVAVFHFSLSLSTEFKEALNGGRQGGNLMSVFC